MGSNRMLLLFAATLLPSLCVSWCVVWLLRLWAPRLGLLDRPNQRKVHTTPIPLGGGIGIWCGWLAPIAAGIFIVYWLRQDAALAQRLLGDWAVHLNGAAERIDVLVGVVFAATTLAVVGLLDDRYGLGWKIRLGIQFLVAGICVAIPELRLTLFLSISAVSAFLTIVWIVAMINAFNMLDNMDGLSGGIGAIVGLLLAAALLMDAEPASGEPQWFVAAFVLVLVGAILGFLIHNRPPARIFMGDAGSYLIGFVLSIATLLGTYANYQEHHLAVLTPLFLMAVPMYDMLTVIAIRIRSGRSPFEADRNHLSHRLVDLGFTKPQAVATIHLLTATCGLGALLLHRLDLLGGVIVTAIVACILALIGLIELTARRRLRAMSNESSMSPSTAPGSLEPSASSSTSADDRPTPTSDS
ncbi:MAG: undecaprenyl/decaprenyl-phosphate alpha-N-acetylglucosaminyl 1-phosphate transferase [Planctomycetales bacterium]|nr:undecaprenyl/decaprenyl-phosphate alpha-N-acetylglucosaminyl 1-phosphate transferase [Planctomycetales bacterium]